MIETEYYSNCCDAPPVGEVNYDELYDSEPMGRCMKCGDNAIFRIENYKDVIRYIELKERKNK
ncbi:MAG: hypothetical protein GOVbin655_52 [Prokaryotic dsDNA virus sp.]|nr:MAG: hypothetical protein GOVbin655_52 [Prokaryotic dsDNA virus sp.]|tara:strand:- start:7785 stop:7973 length:189 start_codon:yes stop_codon:yes gene_type:complete